MLGSLKIALIVAVISLAPLSSEAQETATPDEFHDVFALMKLEGAQAVYAPEPPINVRHPVLVVELAAKNRLPAT